MNVTGKARKDMLKRRMNLYKRMLDDPSIPAAAKVKAEIELAKLEQALNPKRGRG